MRFITGLAVGGAVGYVLGARAGREQYERITAIAESALQNEALNDYVDLDKLKSMLGTRMASASEAIRNATN